MPTSRLVLSLLAAAALAVPATAPASAHTYPGGGYAHLPMAFEPNLGQTDASVDFVARGNGYGVFLSGGDALLTLGETALRIDVGGQTVPPTGNEPLEARVNYLRGSDPSAWRTEIPTFGRVEYAQVYPGIDVAYYGHQGSLEYDFVLAPGAHPSSIQVSFDGAESLELNADGDLILHTAAGDLRQPRPLIHQADGRRVDGGFTLGEQHVGFQVGAYDPTQALIIDPALEYSTYLGGKGDDNFWGNVVSGGIAVDASGGAYVVGSTTSPDFPTTSGALQPSFKGGGMDVFVAKLNPAGGLIYATYLGGVGFEMGNGIAVDRLGNAYVTGLTSSSYDFPLVNPLQPVFGGGAEDAFVAKLNPAGSGLVYSTYLGGNGPGWGEAAYGIAVDGAFNAHVTGVSNSPNFPLVNAAQPALGGMVDAFITRLNASGNAVVYSTFLGGLGEDSGHAIAIDRLGNAYMTGQTGSDGLASSPTVLQPTRNGPSDAFAAKYGPSGNRIYTTYLGGGGDEIAFGLGVDGAGNAYVGGRTGGTFYITAGWFNQTCLDPAGFVAKLNPSATGLVFAGCMDAPGKDGIYGLAVDRAENVYVAGFTLSPKFPVVDAFQPVLNGTQDAFVAKINASGTQLAYSSFLGGKSTEIALGVAVDTSGHAYVTGLTGSADFPVKHAAQPTFGGGAYDAFVVKVDCGV